MKAIVYYKYGSPDVLKLAEMPQPTPDDDQLLVQVHAASINPYDWHFMRGTPYFMRLMAGVFKPKDNILGADVAGKVVGIGRNVTQFQIGDDVFGSVSTGGFAEYCCGKAGGFAKMPTNLTYQEAAALPIAALTALQALRDDGALQAGQKVLINGASGGVGTYAVQIAKALGAHVTGVCSHRNIELVRSLGADHVIDYNQENFTQGSERYDLIIDNVVNHSIADCLNVLNAGGRCAVIGYSGIINLAKLVLFSKSASKRSGKTIGLMSAKMTAADLETVAEMMAAGTVKSVIDKHYPLSEVPEAVRYVETSRASGKVVIDVEHGSLK